MTTYLRECFIVFRRQIRMNLRNPAWVLIGAFQPVLYVLLFGPLLEPLIDQFGATNAYTFFIPGMLLMLSFLLWWGAAVWRVWRFADAGPYARAASIASAVILIQSLVEFPLRTSALAACFAMCVALLIERRTHRAADKSDLWPTRHVVLP